MLLIAVQSSLGYYFSGRGLFARAPLALRSRHPELSPVSSILMCNAVRVFVSKATPTDVHNVFENGSLELFHTSFRTRGVVADASFYCNKELS